MTRSAVQADDARVAPAPPPGRLLRVSPRALLPRLRAVRAPSAGSWRRMSSARRRLTAARDRRGRLPRAPLVQHADRWPVVGVLGATVLAAALFGPVYGGPAPGGLLVPVVAVALVVYSGYEVARRWPRWEGWRPWASLLFGLLAIVETTLQATTVGGLPTQASVRGLVDGARRSWLLTLQSTWPVSPEARLVTFVPLLTLAAAVVGVQVLVRTRARLAALAPSLVVAGLAQAFLPLSTVDAVLVGIGYVALAAVVLGRVTRSGSWFATTAAAVTVPVVLLLALVGAAVDPVHRPAYSLSAATAPPVTPIAVTNPLDDIPYRLEHPTTRLFSVRGATGTDRWPLAVLDRFDGSNWTTDAHYRYLGSRLATDQPARVPTSNHAARIVVDGLPGPWLPSQRGVTSVSGTAPFVDQGTGTMLSDRLRPGLSYRLRYTVPGVGRSGLSEASLDLHTPGALRITGAVPPAVLQIAEAAVGDAPPSFGAALQLERFLRERYRLAVSGALPAGHGWPQILHFLGRSRTGAPTSGTTEQFATAYAVLAREVGIPTRLVVGFRRPAAAAGRPDYVIRNQDVFAWPEVAVRGVGWVPLDPIGIVHGAGSDPSPLAKATDRARALLPKARDGRPKRSAASGRPRRTQANPLPRTRSADSGGPWWAVGLGVALLGVLLAWLIGVPLAKELRHGARRRRLGSAAVVSAWLEARDRLRDHGLAVSPGMTVRDVARASHGLVNGSAQSSLEALGREVDLALWSGAAVGARSVDLAWRTCDTVRHSLADRPLRERLAAAVRLRNLRPPR